MSFLNELKLFSKDVRKAMTGNPGIVAFQIGLNDVESDGFVMVRRARGNDAHSYKVEFKAQFPIAFSLSPDKAKVEVVRQARELGYDIIYLAVKRGGGYVETTVNTTLFPKE